MLHHYLSMCTLFFFFMHLSFHPLPPPPPPPPPSPSSSSFSLPLLQLPTPSSPPSSSSPHVSLSLESVQRRFMETEEGKMMIVHHQLSAIERYVLYCSGLYCSVCTVLYNNENSPPPALCNGEVCTLL